MSSCIYKYLTVFLLIASLMITGCEKANDSIEAAGERAVERWSYIIKNDWDKAYGYETPNYRKTYSAKEFKQSFGTSVEWVEVSVKSVKEIKKGLADVELFLTTKFRGFGNEMIVPGVIKERWRLIDGQWWHVNLKN